MNSAPHHVCVHLDNVPHWEETAAHALNWAWRLGRPLRVVTTPTGNVGQTLVTDPTAQLRGVEWEMVTPEANRDDSANDLHVISDGMTPALKEKLLAKLLRQPEAGVLVCPSNWHPIRRAVALVQDDEADGFLEVAARIIQLVAAEPLVLTVARSEELARRYEEMAEARFDALTMTVEVDSAVGMSLPEAVRWVAKLRHCSLVFVEREKPTWRRWFRGETIQRLLGLAHSLSLLALPESWAESLRITATETPSEAMRI